jgi:NTE family protein
MHREKRLGTSWRSQYAVLLTLCILSPLHAQQASRQHRPTIGVALEGGGAKGLAHVGVLKWFEENHIPVDYIAGTSMGGLIGGLYATGRSPSEIQDLVEKIDWKEVLSGAIPFRDLSFRRKEDLEAYPNSLEFGLRHGLTPPSGLNAGQSVRVLMDRYVLPYSATKNFDDLPIPFRCVAADLVTGKQKVFSEGSLASALRATMSIPVAFAPVRDQGTIYADGGLLDNLPSDIVRQMGADIVIGVHLKVGATDPGSIRSFFGVMNAATGIMIDANVVRGMEHADILLTVDVAGYTTLDFSQIQKIIPQGYASARDRANILDRFSLSNADWVVYLAQRESRKLNSVSAPQFIDVQGTSDQISADVRAALVSNIGQRIDTDRLENDLKLLIGQGRFHSLSYGLIERDGELGLLITAEEKYDSPPWIKPGFAIDGADPYNVQFALGARVTFLDVGGYRSEVRIDASFGSIYSIRGEYYHPFTPASRWFISPEAFAARVPINLYSGDRLIAEYGLRKAAGGVELGYLFDRFSELRFGYEAGYFSASPRIGSTNLPTGSSRTGATRLRYAMERRDNPVIPRRGVAVVANAQWFDADLGATNRFPSAEAVVSAFFPTSSAASLYVVAAGGSTFGYKQTGFPQFSLGAPTRLAAYGVNEFLVDQYFFSRVGYLHQIAALPPFLGTGIYVTGAYELAKPYGLPNAPRLPNDGVAGLVMQTIFGPILIGGAVGEGGHKKWFFELGRIF